MSDEFDWQSDEVVVPTQPAIAVYENANGAVCLRQEGQYPDDDVWIYLSKDHALTVALAILGVAGIDPAALATPRLTTPKNTNSNAERQRNAVTPVTPLLAAE